MSDSTGAILRQDDETPSAALPMSQSEPGLEDDHQGYNEYGWAFCGDAPPEMQPSDQAPAAILPSVSVSLATDDPDVIRKQTGYGSAFCGMDDLPSRQWDTFLYNLRINIAQSKQQLINNPQPSSNANTQSSFDDHSSQAAATLPSSNQKKTCRQVPK